MFKKLQKVYHADVYKLSEKVGVIYIDNNRISIKHLFSLMNEGKPIAINKEAMIVSDKEYAYVLSEPIIRVSLETGRLESAVTNQVAFKLIEEENGLCKYCELKKHTCERLRCHEAYASFIASLDYQTYKPE